MPQLTPEPGLQGATPATIPFSVIDEAIHLLDVPTAPWSIQLDVRVHGHLDEARLRAAIAAAVARHPMARAAKLPSRLRARLDTWNLAPSYTLDPLRTVDCPDDAALAATRVELQGISVPLTESPPFRAVLAQRGDDDVLMLNVNHAAMDGFGVMRLLQSIAGAYAGTPDPPPALDLEQARALPGQLRTGGLIIRVRRQLALSVRMRDLFAPPARVAPDGATDEAGYGFVLSTLPEAETAGLVQKKPAESGDASVGGGRPATVNDVLLAALHLAIDGWNTEHRATCRRIGVLVPANLRPKEWRDDIASNFSLPARISTTRRNRRSAADTLKAVAAQTNRKKQVGMGTAFIELLGQTRLLPLWAKRAFIFALPLTGNRLVDTAMLSNIGRLDHPPSFVSGSGDESGDGALKELWFSPPARMPLGITIGAATVAGKLYLVLRYRRRQFDQAAASRFADLYLSKLRLFTSS